MTLKTLYESGFLINSSEANGNVSWRVRISFTFWKDHFGGRIEGGPRTTQQMRDEMLGGLEKGE